VVVLVVVVQEEEDTTLANSDVTTKYQEAAKIANAVLEGRPIIMEEFHLQAQTYIQ